jgi:N-acetylmuramoyl-L-alanine amidase
MSTDLDEPDADRVDVSGGVQRSGHMIGHRTLLIALASLVLAFVSTAPLGSTAGAAGPLDGLVICIDPGHGGTGEPGAVNPDFDLVESAINLDVSLAVAAQLETQGATVELTRTTDSFAGVLSTRDRYQFCNALGADALVSVHTNSLADETRDGTFALYFKNEDQPLAQAMHDAMLSALRQGPENAGVVFQDFGVRRDPLGVLLKSKMPAVVAEPVMMSHDGWEAPLLQDTIGECSNPDPLGPCRRAQIAAAIAQGVLDYFAALPPDDPGDGGSGGGDKDEAFCAAHPGHPKCP